MRNLIVILEAGAFPAAQQICSKLDDYEVYLFDPLLSDVAANSGLRNIQLFSALGGQSYQTMDREAHFRAFALEEALESARERNGSEISIAGWQHLNLYYLFMAIQWYCGLWDRLQPLLFERNLTLLMNCRPAEYYLNSFVPAMLLLDRLKRHGSSYSVCQYGAQIEPDYWISDLRGNAPPDVADCLLVHLPTCFYDIDYFGAEIAATGLPAIQLKSKRWNAPFSTDRDVGLTPTENIVRGLSPGLQGKIGEFTQCISNELDKQLASHIALPEFRARQVSHIARLYRSQLVMYFELHRFFKDSAPTKLLMSEHDAGFHGPLISFAEHRSVPVILLPHSKVSADIEFQSENIEVLTHPIQGQPIHDAKGRPVKNRRLSYPEFFNSSSPSGKGLRQLSLLLNAVSLNGIPFSPMDIYLDGIRRILVWCNSNGVAMKVRCKPGLSINVILSSYLGVDLSILVSNTSDSMDDHLRDCDLCLMYDLATTGALYLLRNSVPVLNPVVSEQSPAQLAVVHPDVIRPESVELTLERLDALKLDAAALDAFRARQFRAYLVRFEGARTLRNYL